MGDIFGVGAFVSQRGWTISPLLLRRIHELHAEWVREEFTASSLHSGTGSRYSWAQYDAVVNAERHAGLHILGLLDYSNTWAYGDHAVMPHDDMSRLCGDFAAFVYAVARHFRGKIAYWQIWNEPNVSTFWRPFPQADDYADLLAVANRAVKRADPRARVVLAGTSGVDLGFIRNVAARTGGFDVLAVHPYRRLPELDFVRQIAALRGLRRPVWFSEIGWPAGDGCSGCYDETEQARYLVRFYTLAAAAGVQRVFWYDLRDDLHDPSDPEAHFGLLRRDLSAKPAFAAYAYLSHLLAAARYLSADWIGRKGFYAFRFRSRQENTAVVWNAGDTTRPMTLSWPYPQAYLINAGGDLLAELTPDSGRVTITAPQGGEPFYLVDRLPSYRLPPLGALLHPAPARRTPALHPGRAARHARSAVHSGEREVPRQASHSSRRRAAHPVRREHAIRLQPRPAPTRRPSPRPASSPSPPPSIPSPHSARTTRSLS